MVAKTVAAFAAIQILVNGAGAFEYRSLPEVTKTHDHGISTPMFSAPG
jgi:NAD(P)-dependent dehydrogenase (short-subunit alcohol dehydrogenase family)